MGHGDKTLPKRARNGEWTLNLMTKKMKEIFTVPVIQAVHLTVLKWFSSSSILLKGDSSTSPDTRPGISSCVSTSVLVAMAVPRECPHKMTVGGRLTPLNISLIHFMTAFPSSTAVVSDRATGLESP